MYVTETFLEKGVKYTVATEGTYNISASTTTMSRLGPSGSSKIQNNNLEHTREVIPKVKSNVVLGEKRIDVLSIRFIQNRQATKDTRRARA